MIRILNASAKRTVPTKRGYLANRHLATAFTFMRRFFLLSSPMLVNPADLLASAVYLSSKVEEDFVDPVVICKLFQLSHESNVYELEPTLLQGIQFRLQVYHPYPPLLSIITAFTASQIAESLNPKQSTSSSSSSSSVATVTSDMTSEVKSTSSASPSSTPLVTAVLQEITMVIQKRAERLCLFSYLNDAVFTATPARVAHAALTLVCELVVEAAADPAATDAAAPSSPSARELLAALTPDPIPVRSARAATVAKTFLTFLETFGPIASAKQEQRKAFEEASVTLRGELLDAIKLYINDADVTISKTVAHLNEVASDLRKPCQEYRQRVEAEEIERADQESMRRNASERAMREKREAEILGMTPVRPANPTSAASSAVGASGGSAAEDFILFRSNKKMRETPQQLGETPSREDGPPTLRSGIGRRLDLADASDAD